MNVAISNTSLTDTIHYTLSTSSPIVSHTTDTKMRSYNKISDQDVLTISGLLQTTLDQEKIMAYFTREVRRFIQVDNVIFTPPRSSTSTQDVAERYTSIFPIFVDNKPLGSACFSRNSAFTPQENINLKYLLNALTYPLRNSLLYKQAIEAATKDPLTGVGNRAAMDTAMAREIELAKRHEQSLCLLTIDIDYFKRVNDQYGHSTGDCVIKAVTEAATLAMRTCDMIFRFGGEEFVVILSNTSAIGAMLMAERLRNQVEGTSICCDGHEISATVSIGVSSLETQDSSASLFSRADKALYEAKSSGRNCCKASFNL